MSVIRARGRKPSTTIAIIQARSGSKRLPNKVLEKIGELSVLEHIHNRVSKSRYIDEVIVAIPFSPTADPLRDLLKAKNLRFLEGPESDVLERFGHVAETVEADLIVRITGDCPLIQPSAIDQGITLLKQSRSDYVRTSENWPDGLDVEVFSNEALQRARKETTRPYDREHVTSYFRESGTFSCREFDPQEPLPDIRLTLDYLEDLEVIRRVIEAVDDKKPFAEELNRLAVEFPNIFVMNAMYSRNEGARMNAGEKLYSRAKKVIPGGTMLLSKRPEMHAPSGWPSYFDRAKGCYIWDLDGVKYTDVSWMGVGTNVLGYAHPKIDGAVKKTIEKGNLSTLNAPEEVLLAEALCEIHPWADMARFTRSGGEAGAVAVRIARAASGRDHVAFCGYHGWHDWYLSANLGNTAALDGHLLPGLSPSGVPRNLLDTATPFEFNNLENLKQVVSENSSGVIYMEVERSKPPQLDFLQGVRDLATKIGAVLVFDECTSGFRSVLGGQHLKYGVNPDIVVLGKTLGNGYAINAVVGRRVIMEHAQDSFLSSTFWTERIGPTAALATIREMRMSDAPQQINEIGLALQASLAELGRNLDLEIEVAGLPALTTFSVKGSTAQELKTLITKKMLEKKLLGSNAFYVSTAHTPRIIELYMSSLHEILEQHREHFRNGSLAEALPGGMVEFGFSRLT